MKKLFIIICLSIVTKGLAQIKYEPGYLIDNDGKRINIFILNIGWRDNPTTFTYKISESGKPQTGNIQKIKEFGAGTYLKYERFHTSIDRSSDQVSNMSRQSEPEFEVQTVFLQHLVSGEADLYVYREGILERFFISTPVSGLTPLIHKEYLKGNGIANNNKFRQQLYSLASCGENPADQLRGVSYNENDLIAYLGRYNNCQQAEYHVYQKLGEKTQINFSVKGGIDFGSMEIQKGIHVKGADPTVKPSLRLGAEVEMVLPFNRNKWAVFVEPTYISHSVEKEDYELDPVYQPGEVDLSIEYDFITVTTGVRHFFFLTDSSKIFLSGGISFDWALQSDIYIDRNGSYELDPELNEIKSGLSYILGFGYNHHRLSGEIRFYTPKSRTGYNQVPKHYELDWKSRMRSISVALGYQLF